MLKMKIAAIMISFMQCCYPVAGTVTEINGDIATVTTYTGIEYEIPAGDYYVGDDVAMTAYTMGTDDATDDLVITARYAGDL